MPHRFVLEGAEHSVSLAGESASVDDKTLSVLVHRIGTSLVMVRLDEKLYTAHVARTPDGFLVHSRGRVFTVNRAEAVASDAGASVSSGEITSPMPGRVVKVLVKEGDAVKEQQVLAILEAMKMEHPLRAPFDGAVTKIAAKADEQVTAGSLVVLVSKLDAGER